jgi:hypothetical protein
MLSRSPWSTRLVSDAHAPSRIARRALPTALEKELGAVAPGSQASFSPPIERLSV